jgi:hypothetical protein
MDSPSEVIARLSARLEALEQRVYQLEHPPEVHPASVIAAVAAKDALEIGANSRTEAAPFADAGGTFPVLGKAVLGMAGAYLLRALAEAGTFPKLAVVVLAIVYAGTWLVGAARVRAGRSFAGFTYALTSALILAPMLWELTLRFKVLSPSISAGVLAAFAIGALALTWRRAVAPVFWVGYAASLLAALVLMIATQDLAPFLCAILVVALASEMAACRGHALNGRILAAGVADVGVAALLYIYSMPESSRAAYSSVSVPALIALASIPFFLYVASITLQSALRARRITLAEMMQIVLTFLFASFGAMTFSSGEQRAAVGIVCVALSAAGYAVAFARFRDQSSSRNLNAYTTCSTAFFVFGCFLSLPQLWLAIALGAAAIAATTVGARERLPVLEFQGAAYLAAAAAFSGLLMFDEHSLIGSQPLAPAWIFAMIFACALLCYGLGARSRGPGWRERISQGTSAALATATAAALAMSLLAHLVERARALNIAPPAGLMEFLQTLILCAAALGLAASGSRGRRQELIWLAYTTVVLTAAKILLEDVRHGHLVAIAASFFLYAGTLILLPRLAGHRHQEPARDEMAA